ncbi:MAG: HRDC domain-containing protein [Verrucomicrobiales bacterium]|nr:HRDC domain-containing protein [Verrucomicrobiales bacterium]
MKFHLFQYPLPAPEPLEDVNAFLASRRVASVSHHIVHGAAGSMLVFVVQTVGEAVEKVAKQEKVDYRELMTPEDFQRFSRLRDERKKIAEAEGVPVYAVFTNAQLAQMVQGRCGTMADLMAVDGIGKARVEKHGERLLATLLAAEPAKP